MDVGKVDDDKDATSGGGKKKTGKRDGEKEDEGEELTEEQLENLLLGPKDRREFLLSQIGCFTVFVL